MSYKTFFGLQNRAEFLYNFWTCYKCEILSQHDAFKLLQHATEFDISQFRVGRAHLCRFAICLSFYKLRKPGQLLQFLSKT